MARTAVSPWIGLPFLGLVSGVIYDALHLACGERSGCDRLFTYNLSHFRRLEAKGIAISAP